MNKYRGAVNVTLGAKEFVLVPSFECMAHIETATGKAIFGIITELGDPKTCRLTTLVEVIRAGVIGSGAKPKEVPSAAEVGALLQSKGFTSILPPLFQFLKNGIAADEDLGPEVEEGKPGE